MLSYILIYVFTFSYQVILIMDANLWYIIDENIEHNRNSLSGFGLFGKSGFGIAGISTFGIAASLGFSTAGI